MRRIMVAIAAQIGDFDLLRRAGRRVIICSSWHRRSSAWSHVSYRPPSGRGTNPHSAHAIAISTNDMETPPPIVNRAPPVFPNLV